MRRGFGLSSSVRIYRRGCLYKFTFSMVLGATKGLTSAQSVAKIQGALIMKMFSMTSG